MSEQMVTIYHPEQGSEGKDSPRAIVTREAFLEVWQEKGFVLDELAPMDTYTYSGLPTPESELELPAQPPADTDGVAFDPNAPVTPAEEVPPPPAKPVELQGEDG